MKRWQQLGPHDTRALRDWGVCVRRMFHGTMPYLVGSSYTSSEWRDVDVRVMLEDDEYWSLCDRLWLPDLNMIVSAWGARVTGLPIDFQVQHRDVANATEHGPRGAIGIANDF